MKAKRKHFSNNNSSLLTETTGESAEAVVVNERQQSNSYFLIAFGILNTICFMLVLSALSFSLNRSIRPWHFPLALCSSIAINYIATKYYSGSAYKSIFMKTTGILLALIVLSIGIGACIYDTSWDGQSYHKEALIKLKEGWNPFYTQLSSHTACQTWLNHYGKGAEIPQAAIYSFLNRIEAGKATNILLIFASFCLCVHLFASLNKLRPFKVYLLSSLFALNPIATSQMFTYYVDGQIASLLCCLIVAGIWLYKNSIDKYILALFGSIIILTVNIKFTAVVFTGVLISGLLIALLYKSKASRFKVVLITAGISSIMGVCLVGFNPYVTNTLHHRAPFYPVMGKSAIDIMKVNAPQGFLDKNRFEKFFISIFSHPDNILPQMNRSPELKIPFIVNRADIANTGNYDTRISGFGFLFGEIVLLSTLLLGGIVYLCRKESARCLGLTYIIGILLFSVFLVSEAWWARYVPQLWFVPLTILIAGESMKSIPIKYTSVAVYALLVVNSGSVLALSLTEMVTRSRCVNDQLMQFKDAHSVIKVDFGPFKSIRMRFNENNIKYVEDNITGGYGVTDDGKHVTYIEGSYFKSKAIY